MAFTQFDNPVLRADGSLEVGGPFILDADDAGRILGDVIIRFLVVQDSDRNRDEGAPDAMVEDTATWTDADGAQWRHVVPANRVPDFRVDARVRGIGLAVLVKQAPAPSPDEPPSFETVTWCVSKRVVGETAGG